MIHALAAQVQNHLYYPDPMPLYVVLGVLVANMMKGKPVWMMLIGAPSGGRSTILDTIVNIPKVHITGKIKGDGSFLSATGAKERSKNATGGLLRKMGLRGLMVASDFTSVLSLNWDSMKEVVGALREIFDGRWSRDVGSDGGSSIIWGHPDKGRLGFLGACTPKIDSFHGVIQELGQRWLYYRFPNSDGFGETMATLDQGDMEGTTQELRDLVCGFIGGLVNDEGVELDWDSWVPRKLTNAEKNRIYSMATLMVHVRSQVSRDAKTREVDDVVNPEGPSRMGGSLGQLYLAFEAMGLGDLERWKIVGKVALDSAPELRVRMLLLLREAGDEFGMGCSAGLGELRDELRVGKKTIEFIAEDLDRLGVVEFKEGRVRLKSWAIKQLSTGWKI